MRLAWTLCWKEWRIVLDTPLGYVLAASFLLASGFFFGNNLFLVGQADMRGYFSIMPLLLMFFTPAMSMRMLAEEQQYGTFELLATMPVRTLDIVIGKFLAIWMQWMVLLAFTSLYPLSLMLLGHLDVGQVLASYLALLLLAATYASICLYASSLTYHSIVAYVIGFALLFALFLITQAAPTLAPFIQDLSVMMSPISHYQSILRGMVMLDDVMLFVSMSLLFLSLTWFQLERRRWR
ncbi:MAG: ABC transporter permease subunit [Mariprofundaceae bacterium]